MFYLLLVSLIWAFSFGITKYVLFDEISSINPALAAVVRLLLSALVFLPFIKKVQNKKLFFQLALIGAVQFGLMYIFLMESYAYAKNAWNVAFFTLFTPIYVILIYDFYAKKFSLKSLLLVLLSVVGAGLVIYDSSSLKETITCFLLLQASNLCFAWGQVYYKKIASTFKNDDKSFFWLVYLSATLTAIIWLLIKEQGSVSLDISLKQFSALIYLGVVASGLCFFWWNKGAKLTNPTSLAILNNLKTPLAVSVSFLFFSEPTNLLALTFSFAIMSLTIIASKTHTSP